VNEPISSGGRPTRASDKVRPIPGLWLRHRYARLLLAAKAEVAAGEVAAAGAAVERIFALFEAKGLEVPLRADLMRALVAWNQERHDETARSVRCAGDKLNRRLALEQDARRLHELDYLRAYGWTLLWWSEQCGAKVRWEEFADLARPAPVQLSRVSRTTREMFPVDAEVFANAGGQA
jgi:hypothetical protein